MSSVGTEGTRPLTAAVRGNVFRLDVNFAPVAYGGA
jgi:hypothetical protein